MTIEESTPSAYPTCKQPNTCDLHPATLLPNAKGLRLITRSQTNTKRQAQTTNTESSVIFRPSPKVAQSKPPQRYVIYQIISHGVNDDQEHPSARPVEPTYRVPWYGFDSDDNTSEPIRHIPRNKIVSYYERIRQPLPDNLDEAQQG